MPLVAWRTLPDPTAHLRGRVPDLNVVFRTDDNGTLAALVAEGLGAAIVPGLVVDPRNTSVVALPVGSRIPPTDDRARLASRPLPLRRRGGVRRDRAGARRRLRAAPGGRAQRTSQRLGGQYRATTGPMKAERFTGPQMRESQEPIRLSPIMKYCCGPSRGHAFVSESRSLGEMYGSARRLPVDVDVAVPLGDDLAGQADHALEIRAAFLAALLLRAAARGRPRSRRGSGSRNR